MPSIDKHFLRGKVTLSCANGVYWPLSVPLLQWQARNDRLETDYAASASAHQQGSSGGQLFESLSKERDAMVAFELAKYFESSGQNAMPQKWYSAAAERFRRADWKVKAQEAAVRLGGAPGEIPIGIGSSYSVEFALTPPAGFDPGARFAIRTEQKRSNHRWRSVAKSNRQQKAQRIRQCLPGLRERAGRRGRRGGGTGAKAGCEGTGGCSSQHTIEAPAPRADCPPAVFEESAEPLLLGKHSRAIPSLPVEPIGEPGGPTGRVVTAIPGLSSRISLLEMQFAD